MNIVPGCQGKEDHVVTDADKAIFNVAEQHPCAPDIGVNSADGIIVGSRVRQFYAFFAHFAVFKRMLFGNFKFPNNSPERFSPFFCA
jgi:hypothetical protein